MIFNFTYKSTTRVITIPSIIKFNNKTNELMDRAYSTYMSKTDCIISFDKKASIYFSENSEEMEKILKRVDSAVRTMKGKLYSYIKFDDEHEDLFEITKNKDGSLSVIDKDDNVLNILYIQQD